MKMQHVALLAVKLGAGRCGHLKEAGHFSSLKLSSPKEACGSRDGDGQTTRAGYEMRQPKRTARGRRQRFPAHFPKWLLALELCCLRVNL